MRIETGNAGATSSKYDSVYVMMTGDDALSHLQGLTEIDVIEDRMEPIPPPEGWTEELYDRRIIRGVITIRLHMWEERSPKFGKDYFLGGITIVEERRRYLMNEVALDYEEATNTLTITTLEQHIEV